MRKYSLLLATALALFVAKSPLLAEEEFGNVEAGDIPKLRSASDAAERAMAKMRAAPGLKVELWAAEPLLANPVALNFDNRGRCYLVETWRFEHGVIDIRPHMDWLDDDLASKSVEDRIALVHRKMGPNARTFAKYP